jgi:hypothetical protein
MASGRLGRCIIGNRSGAEVYHNDSGKEVAVTIFAQAISTTLNSELTTVVGVAATTLGSTVIVANSGQAGTYQSTIALNFSCSYCRCGTGNAYPAPSVASTFQGAYRTWRCCSASSSDYYGAYCTMAPTFISTEGNITDTCITGYSCQCSNCCVPIVYGGNEIQSPAVWIDAQEPRVCWDTVHGPMYQSNVVGWYPLAYCQSGMCCRRCCWPQSSNSFITQRQIGTGVTAAQRAAQFMANPLCKCADNDTWFMPQGGTNNTFPIQNYQGCAESNGCCCRGGSHCNIQGCKMRYEADYHGSHLYTFFNYYALCNTPSSTDRTWNQGIRCCITASNCDQTCTQWDNGYQAWASLTDQGAYKFDCGKYVSPMYWMVAWCGGSSGSSSCCNWGRVEQGMGYRVRVNCNQSCCGCICWQHDGGKGLCDSGCSLNATRLFYAVCRWTCKIQCECRPRNCPTNDKRMSPYGFMYGMTNCFAMVFAGNETSNTQEYNFGFNDFCYWNCCWCQYCPCLWTAGFRFRIPHENLSPKNDEFTVKYVAWNPHDSYVYTAIRSSNAADCGIFRIDPHEVRRQAGPFCGCSQASCQCCGNGCNQYIYGPGAVDWATTFGHDGGGGACALCRTAEFPSCWAQSKYTSGGMCVSCLYRSAKCQWTIGLYNHDTKKWDGYTSKNLHEWESAGDPFVENASDTLTRTITDDYRCVVEVCNCFFANIDCSGLIDYKVSANQYERTGIVLSNGDRVSVNNNSDHKTTVQVWGFEG